MLSGNFLHGSSQETLRVIEAGQPERNGARTLLQPVIELEVSVYETLDPTTEGWSQPGDLSTRLELPLGWDTGIEDFIDSIDQFGSHRHGTINSLNHFVHHRTNDVQHDLKLLNFLSQEDVERNVLVWIETARNLHCRELFFVVLFDEVLWQLLDQVLLELVTDFIFHGTARATTAFLRHGIN